MSDKEKVKSDKSDNKKSDKVKSDKSNNEDTSEKLCEKIVDVLNDRLAKRIAVIDLRSVAGIADYFVICESDNTAHTSAIASGMIDIMKEKHAARPWRCEGETEGRWVLVDYVDVVVHVMLADVRALYDLEGLWSKKSAAKSF